MSVSILVVEDHPEVRESIRALLATEGYEVHCAENSDEALAVLGRLPRPCILLWDPMTPRQSWSMIDRATMEGVHVATLPVSLASTSAPGSDLKTTTRRLTSEEAILRIVREYCPMKDAANL